MAWVWLIVAGLCEMVGVAMINEVHKRRNLVSYLGMILGFSASFIFLALAMESLPMGTAYAVWTGIGAAGGALMGILFYRESGDWRRIFFILLILSSAVGLKLVS